MKSEIILNPKENGPPGLRAAAGRNRKTFRIMVALLTKVHGQLIGLGFKK